MKLIIALLIFIVLVAFAAVSLAPTLPRQTSNGLSLRSLLTAVGCETACWQGIQPDSTLAEFAARSVKLTGIANTRVALLGGPGRAYIYELANPNPLTTSPNVATAYVDFDSEVTFVWQVGLSALDLCIATVIEAYGIPPVFREMPDTILWPMPGHIGLGYPQEGLLFWYKRETARIVSAVLMPGSRVTSVLDSGDYLQWATILADSPHCRDNFLQ